LGERGAVASSPEVFRAAGRQQSRLAAIDQASRRAYPELEFGGFTRIDGTVAFAIRVQALLGLSKVVVDLGCGRGWRSEDPCALRVQLQDLRGPARRVIGLDQDSSAAVNPFINEFRIITEGRSWPLATGEADFVYCDSVLEHVRDTATFFAELARILHPGGYACFRTPNRWGYPALAAQLIPSRWHAKTTSYVQRDREACDVFPTFYRCNTRLRLKRLLHENGFDACVYANEAEPGYLAFSAAVFRLGTYVHALLPPALKSTLFAFARRR
jgi:SAM-dependent methyltransferase